MEQHVLGYYVFCSVRGWLTDDEKTWSSSFNDAQEFTAAQLANDIGERESPGATDSFFVMACMGSM